MVWFAAGLFVGVCAACCVAWGAMEWYVRHDPQGWYFRALDQRPGGRDS